MKSAVFGFLLAGLVMASALAHGLLGWPAIRESLRHASVGRDLLGGLAVGWFFGSAAMLTFSYVIFLQALRRLGKRPADTGALWGIAAMYLVFGGLALLVRGYSPHFVLFVLTGVLTGVFAVSCRQGTGSQGQ